jgi:hypothetical protein
MSALRNFSALVLLFVLLAYICGLISFGALNDYISERTEPQLTSVEGFSAEAAVESRFNRDLPSSATDVYQSSEGDRYYWLRFTVNRPDVNNLFSGSQFITCRFPLQANYRPIFEFDRVLTAAEQAALSWWTPDSETVRVFSGGECTGTDYRFFRMFMDFTDAQRVTVFMEVAQIPE